MGVSISYGLWIWINSDYEISLSFGSSGKFYAQIKQGAPYELFFSAAQDKPEALQKEGVVIETSRFTYAIGRLALWSNCADSTHQIETKLKDGSLCVYSLKTLHRWLVAFQRHQLKFSNGESIYQLLDFLHIKPTFQTNLR